MRYTTEYNPMDCTGCGKRFADGDEFVVVSHHPYLGEKYGPYVFHESCWLRHPWSKEQAVIVSSTTQAPICVWCSIRITGDTPGGKLVEFDGDNWHKKCLDQYKAHTPAAEEAAGGDRAP